MIIKRPIRPERVRQVPPGFSWVDHRLVRQDFLSRCGHGALALYLFLVTVADAQGLSYYSDAAIGRRLGLTSAELAEARRQLARADLIAFEKPLYQVLSLDPAPAPALAPALPGGSAEEPRRSGQAQPAGEILRRILQAAGGGS